MGGGTHAACLFARGHCKPPWPLGRGRPAHAACQGAGVEAELAARGVGSGAACNTDVQHMRVVVAAIFCVLSLAAARRCGVRRRAQCSPRPALTFVPCCAVPPCPALLAPQSCMKPATDIFISSQQMVASIVVLPLMYGEQNLGGLYFTLETPSNFQNIKDMLMGFVNSIVLVLLQKLEGQLHHMWDAVVQVGTVPGTTVRWQNPGSKQVLGSSDECACITASGMGRVCLTAEFVLSRSVGETLRAVVCFSDPCVCGVLHAAALCCWWCCSDRWP